MDPVQQAEKQLDAKVDAAVNSKVQALMESKGFTKSGILDWLKNTDTDKQVASKERMVDAIVRNNGFARSVDAERIADSKKRANSAVSYAEMVDALSTTEATIFIPRVMSRIVREAVEPAIVLTSLFRRIRIPGMTTMVQFPSIGGMSAEDIPEGGEYPDQKIEGYGYSTAMIGKSGLKVRLTEEVMRYSSFDLVGLHARAAGRALVRHKEKKCATAIEGNAQVSYDNSGGTSVHGKTSGRDINTNGNDTIIIHDIFQMYADMVNNGFIPTDFIVNPIGWLIFAREATMRAWAFQHGGALFNPVEGEPGRGQNEDDPLGPSSGGGSTYGTINQATTRGQMARQIFPANIGMIVSPFIAFDSAAQTTSIILVDRDEVGILVEDEPISMDRFEDPHRDIMAMKWRERYGLAVSNEGEGMVQAKNVSIAKGFDFETSATLQISPTGNPVLGPIV
jgi:hypothetical protein